MMMMISQSTPGLGLRQKGRQEILPTTLLASDLHDGGHDHGDGDCDDDDKSYDDDVDDSNDEDGCYNCYDAPPTPLIRSDNDANNEVDEGGDEISI